MQSIDPERIEMTMRLAEHLADRFGRANVDFDKRNSRFTLKCVDVACGIMHWIDKHKDKLTQGDV